MGVLFASSCCQHTARLLAIELANYGSLLCAKRGFTTPFLRVAQLSRARAPWCASWPLHTLSLLLHFFAVEKLLDTGSSFVRLASARATYFFSKLCIYIDTCERCVYICVHVEMCIIWHDMHIENVRSLQNIKSEYRECISNMHHVRIGIDAKNRSLSSKCQHQSVLQPQQVGDQQGGNRQ